MEADPTEISPKPAASSAGPEVILADRYRILADSPIPELALDDAPAFTARDQRNPSRGLFARVLDAKLQPRIEIAIQLKLVREARILAPVEWGPVAWSGGSRRFALLFDRPDTGPLMPTLDARITPMPPEEICRRILAPAVITLNDFARRGMTHRAIRPTNLFMQGGNAGLLLGDCVTAQPALHQPAIFETVESAMTHPAARGAGQIRDDMYALGATILCLAIGRCPVAGMPEAELIAAKLERDSLTTLCNGERTPPALREAFRGLLADDPAERWTIEDLAQWLGGGLRRQVHPLTQHRVDRGFELDGREYKNLRLLAHALGQDWNRTLPILRSRALDTWLKRSLPDQPYAQDIAAVITAAQHESNPAVAENKMVMLVCTHLDPTGPMRLKGISTTVEGYGTALAHTVITDDRPAISALAEAISRGSVIDWVQLRATQTAAVDVDGPGKAFKRLQQFLRQSGPGYGLERCVYDLNPYLPCLSPMLADRYIHTLSELLPALERIVAERGSLPTLIDRHVVAFVACHFSKRIDSELAAMEDGRGESIRAKLGVVGMFAKLQEQYGPDSLPVLTAWLAKEVAPASGQFQSKTLREQVARNLTMVADGGSIPGLVRCLNDDRLRARDEQARLAAVNEYAGTVREIATLQSRDFVAAARLTGWRLAARVSGGIAIAAMIAIALRTTGF